MMVAVSDVSCEDVAIRTPVHPLKRYRTITNFLKVFLHIEICCPRFPKIEDAL